MFIKYRNLLNPKRNKHIQKTSFYSVSYSGLHSVNTIKIIYSFTTLFIQFIYLDLFTRKREKKATINVYSDEI